MKRAMLITVGSGPGIENAIAYSIRRHIPKLVVFCCSDKTKDTVEKVKEIMKEEMPEVSIKENPEVNDFENIFDTYCEYIEELERQGYHHDEIVADYTSGTKAMSAALATAGIVCRLDSLSYVYSYNRDDTYGRSKTAGMKASSLTPNLIYTKQRIDFARKYINKYQFSTAIDLLSKDIHPKFDEESQWLTLIAQAYDTWDKFNFQEARDLFSRISVHPLSLSSNLKEIFIGHKKLTGQLLHQTEIYTKAIEKTIKSEPVPEADSALLTQHITFDLINNAQRRSKEAKYDDAVARLYRALECMAQIVFLKKTGFVNSKCPLNKLPEILQHQFADAGVDGKISIGLLQTFTALEIMNIETGKQFMKQKEKWLGVLEMRNNAILAHGLRPVSEEDYEKYFSMIKTLMPGYSPTEWPVF
jgi:CRISPR-associated protein (TIGR02710 family)